jgi:hypothetical protein
MLSSVVKFATSINTEKQRSRRVDLRSGGVDDLCAKSSSISNSSLSPIFVYTVEYGVLNKECKCPFWFERMEFPWTELIGWQKEFC